MNADERRYGGDGVTATEKTRQRQRHDNGVDYLVNASGATTMLGSVVLGAVSASVLFRVCQEIVLGGIDFGRSFTRIR